MGGVGSLQFITAGFFYEKQKVSLNVHKNRKSQLFILYKKTESCDNLRKKLLSNKTDYVIIQSQYRKRYR